MTSQAAYPLVCRPLFKSKIWGGRNLADVLGMDLPAGQKVGEAWVVADLPEGCSAIANGAMEGRPLTEVAEAWGEKLTGPAWRGKPTGGRFPLLVKFLDAQDDLSVQVHPDEDACGKHFPDDFSKDESWIVVHAEPGGSILHGFRPEATLEDFDRELQKGDVVELMRRVEVRPGQVFRVAPRTVHALCKGVMILEIQEPSDSTFRIYDYDRLGDDGKPRALHLDAARKVMRFGDDSPPEASPRLEACDWGDLEVLIDVDAYRIERLRPRRAVAWQVDPRSAQVVVVLQGDGVLESMGRQVPLRRGQVGILPAVAGQALLRFDAPDGVAVLAGAGGHPLAHGSESA